MSDFQSFLDQALKEVVLEKPNEVFLPQEYNLTNEVSDLISRTRNQVGMTQKELAQISGVSQANLSRIENGSYTPSLSVLKRIADGLGKRVVITFEDREGGY